MPVSSVWPKPSLPPRDRDCSEVKKQLAELRDMATRYDLSFDTALKRLEGRMTFLEQRVQPMEQKSRAMRAEHG